jgi:hypothetical protein
MKNYKLKRSASRSGIKSISAPMSSSSLRSSFLFVHVPEHRVGGLVDELRFVPLVQFAQTAADGGTFVVRQLRQFGKDFNRAHGNKLTLARWTGKRGFAAPLLPGKQSARRENVADSFGCLLR